MGKTIRMIAEEIGVSKQAVYKRFTGKLKNVCAPYVYTEYNCIYLTEEGEAIIKKDFADNPCAVPVHTQYIRSASVPAYVSDTEQSRAESNPNIPTSSETSSQPNTAPVNASAANAHTYTASDNASNMDPLQPNSESEISSVYVSDTEHIRSASADTVQDNIQFTGANKQPDIPVSAVTDNANSVKCFSSVCTDIPYAAGEGSAYGDSVYDTEQIRSDANQSVSYTSEIAQKAEKYEAENAELKEKLHEMELKLIKINAEKEKSDEKIKFLDQKLNDKDQLIADQRRSIDKIDTERKILTASLLKNNSFIENLIKLPLSKRIFGWKDVKKQLTDSQNDVMSDVAAGESDASNTVIETTISDTDIHNQ